MKEYAVLFSLKPAVKLDPKMSSLTLEFMETEGSKRIIVSKIEEEMAGHKIQSGLLFRVFVQANNSKEAINKAKSFVDRIVSFITLITGVGLRTPLEELVYEVTPQVSERDFMQIYYDPFNVAISRRILDHLVMVLYSQTRTLVYIVLI